MTEKEFDLLYAVHKEKSINDFDKATISKSQEAIYNKPLHLTN